jgi:hypothetical protein
VISTKVACTRGILGSQQHIPDRATAHLGEGIAGGLLAGAIEADDLALAIEHHHQAAQGFQHGCGEVVLLMKQCESVRLMLSGSRGRCVRLVVI